MPWQQVPSFMTDLRGREGMVARALEFTILEREQDWRGARRDLVGIRLRCQNLDHPEGADEVEPRARGAAEPARARNPALAAARGRAPVPDPPGDRRRVPARPYGPRRQHPRFRSSFSTWCAEATRFEPAVCEAALAHVIRDKVERSYQRGTMLQKGRQLMEAWSAYCSSSPAKLEASVVWLRV
jgi:hypothetical protein